EARGARSAALAWNVGRHASTLLSRMARGSCRAAATVKAVSTVAGRACGPARSSCETPAGRGGGGAKGPGHLWCVRSINRQCVVREELGGQAEAIRQVV